MMMKKTILLPIISIIVIAGIILIFTFSSYKQNGQSSSLENMIVGKWVVTEAYEFNESDYFDYIEEDNESVLDLYQDDSLIGHIWDMKNDNSFSFMVNNTPIKTGKWSVEGNDRLMLSSEFFEESELYYDEETNEKISTIFHFDEEYDCTVKYVDRNKLTLIGLWSGTSWKEEIHENGDTVPMMPPSYVSAFKYSFVRMK